LEKRQKNQPTPNDRRGPFAKRKDLSRKKTCPLAREEKITTEAWKKPGVSGWKIKAKNEHALSADAKLNFLKWGEGRNAKKATNRKIRRLPRQL